MGRRYQTSHQNRCPNQLHRWTVPFLAGHDCIIRSIQQKRSNFVSAYITAITESKFPSHTKKIKTCLFFFGSFSPLYSFTSWKHVKVSCSQLWVKRSTVQTHERVCTRDEKYITTIFYSVKALFSLSVSVLAKYVHHNQHRLCCAGKNATVSVRDQFFLVLYVNSITRLASRTESFSGTLPSSEFHWFLR